MWHLNGHTHVSSSIFDICSFAHPVFAICVFDVNYISELAPCGPGAIPSTLIF